EVPDRYDFQAERKDLEDGHWRTVGRDTISSFSAVAYFFARDLHQRLDVPVGIINASLGGSPVQAWLSEDALKSFPEHYNEAQRFKDPDLIKRIEKEDQARANEWYQTRDKKDRGLKNGEPRWLG